MHAAACRQAPAGERRRVLGQRNHDCFPRCRPFRNPSSLQRTWTLCRGTDPLTRGERQVLQARVARARSEQRDVLRARIVLAAAAKDPNAVIAVELGVTVDTVRKWRGRFATGHLEGLNDLPAVAGRGCSRLW